MFSSRKTAAPSTGYNLNKSLRFRSSASAYLSRTPSVAGNQQKWTWSGWVKKAQNGANGTLFGSGTGASTYDICFFNSNFISTNDKFNLYLGNGTYYLVSNAVYRDPSAWYHVVVAVDSTQATASNRMRAYINGSEITSWTSTAYPAQNATVTNYWNTTTNQTIGSFTGYSGYYLDGYMTEVNFIDGQALTPSSFGSTNALTGVWQPAKYTGTYGTNGFYLPFTNTTSTTTLGYDFSGNSNNWTTNNISLTAGSTYDSMTDVPTLTSATAANFCVLNPLDWGSTNFPCSNGNLTWITTTTANGFTRGSIGMTTGKWYWEVYATSVGAGSCYVGLAKNNSSTASTGQAIYTANTGNKCIEGTSTAYGSSWTTGDLIGVAYDADAGTLTFYKNNTTQGAITLSGYAGVNVCPVVVDASSLAFTLDCNFGQQPFSYTPPTNFVALNTYNI